MSYAHTQTGFLPILFGIIICLMGVLVFFVSQEIQVILLITNAVLIITVLLFYSLTVSVDNRYVIASFGVGLIKKKFLLKDIISIKQVRNKWWYGWGIRITPHGWLYNVSGLDAVELTFDSGKKVRLGTDDTNRLVNEITKRIKKEKIS